MINLTAEQSGKFKYPPGCPVYICNEDNPSFLQTYGIVDTCLLQLSGLGQEAKIHYEVMLGDHHDHEGQNNGGIARTAGAGGDANGDGGDGGVVGRRIQVPEKRLRYRTGCTVTVTETSSITSSNTTAISSNGTASDSDSGSGSATTMDGIIRGICDITGIGIEGSAHVSPGTNSMVPVSLSDTFCYSIQLFSGMSGNKSTLVHDVKPDDVTYRPPTIKRLEKTEAEKVEQVQAQAQAQAQAQVEAKTEVHVQTEANTYAETDNNTQQQDDNKQNEERMEEEVHAHVYSPSHLEEERGEDDNTCNDNDSERMEISSSDEDNESDSDNEHERERERDYNNHVIDADDDATKVSEVSLSLAEATPSQVLSMNADVAATTTVTRTANSTVTSSAHEVEAEPEPEPEEAVVEPEPEPEPQPAESQQVDQAVQEPSSPSRRRISLDENQTRQKSISMKESIMKRVKSEPGTCTAMMIPKAKRHQSHCTTTSAISASAKPSTDALSTDTDARSSRTDPKPAHTSQSSSGERSNVVTTAASTSISTSTSQMRKETRGRKGDPRMNKALAAMLKNPSMNPYDAMVEGGFIFSDGTDQDGVSVSQRKARLKNRFKLARKREEAESNAKTGTSEAELLKKASGLGKTAPGLDQPVSTIARTSKSIDKTHTPALSGQKDGNAPNTCVQTNTNTGTHTGTETNSAQNENTALSPRQMFEQRKLKRRLEKEKQNNSQNKHHKKSGPGMAKVVATGVKTGSGSTSASVSTSVPTVSQHRVKAESKPGYLSQFLDTAPSQPQTQEKQEHHKSTISIASVANVPLRQVSQEQSKLLPEMQKQTLIHRKSIPKKKSAPLPGNGMKIPRRSSNNDANKSFFPENSFMLALAPPPLDPPPKLEKKQPLKSKKTAAKNHQLGGSGSAPIQVQPNQAQQHVAMPIVKNFLPRSNDPQRFGYVWEIRVPYGIVDRLKMKNFIVGPNSRNRIQWQNITGCHHVRYWDFPDLLIHKVYLYAHLDKTAKDGATTLNKQIEQKFGDVGSFVHQPDIMMERARNQQRLHQLHHQQYQQNYLGSQY